MSRRGQTSLCRPPAATVPTGENREGSRSAEGEPLLQIAFLTELFQKAKSMGIHTVLDTSGNPFTEGEPFFSKWTKLMDYPLTGIQPPTAERVRNAERILKLDSGLDKTKYS